MDDPLKLTYIIKQPGLDQNGSYWPREVIDKAIAQFYKRLGSECNHEVPSSMCGTCMNPNKDFYPQVEELEPR